MSSSILRLLAIAAATAAFAACSARAPTVYATPDYHSWQRTTNVVLDYPIPGHQDRFRIPRMNAVGFTAAPTMVNGKRRWEFPDGTVIAKEVYATSRPSPGAAPVQLTIMVKAPRDPHSHAVVLAGVIIKRQRRICCCFVRLRFCAKVREYEKA